MFGGMNPDTKQFIAEAERFNTVENKWEEIADMLEGRGNAFGAATQEKVFVAGGLRNGEILKTCDMYNTSTNESNGNSLEAESVRRCLHMEVGSSERKAIHSG